MLTTSDKPLFIFDLANNHMGSVAHGLRIIRDVRQATEGFDFDFAFKFQYRHLDTFIHPAYRDRMDVKYVKRFSETRLTEAEFSRLKKEVDKLGFLSICTPFDEESVNLIEQQGFHFIKIASCSFTDWPLLERVAQSPKPIIASTAGIALDDMDKVVSFFEHRQKQLALMHCVAQYPTPDHALQLNQLDLLKTRYPTVRLGYSTHERPDNYEAVKMAVAKGATIFEKHVGVVTREHSLNAYSATPEQVRWWVASAQEALAMAGPAGDRPPFSPQELDTLRALRRGAFAKYPLTRGQKIEPADLFLAIPTVEGQVTANDLSKYTHFYADVDLDANQPLLLAAVQQVHVRERVYDIVQRVKALLHESRAVVPGRSDFDISHHYGLNRFEEYGGTIINFVNREYCKKLIVMLPGQKHPEQYHMLKEETFHVLYGTLALTLNGVAREHHRGDIVTVERGVKHSFFSPTGAVIEELSSTHYKDDSFYTDPAINGNAGRKTQLTYWVD